MTSSSHSNHRLWRRVVGWVAAYALVLYVVLAGVAATQLAAAHASAPGNAGFELCLTGADGATHPADSHHDTCKFHCVSIAGAAPAVALAVLALLFFSAAGKRIVHRFPIRHFDLLRRAGLGSRAPPLHA